MRDKLLRTALLAEVTAILLSRYPAPAARTLWLLVALAVYWLIATGIRIVYALQFVVTAVGIVVAATVGGWAAIAYAVEAGALASLWCQERRARESVA